MALVLGLIVVFNLSAPVFATDIQSSKGQEKSYYGYTFSERMLPNGDYEICSYYNGVLHKQYTLSEGSKEIEVESKSLIPGEERKSSSYTIPGATAYYPASAPLLRAERWASLGFINYKNQPSLGNVRIQMMAYGNNETKQLPLNVQSNTFFDDVAVFKFYSRYTYPGVKNYSSY